MKFKELAAYIFDVRFPVRITATQALLIQPDAPTIGIETPGDMNGYDMNGTHYEIESPNHDLYVQMLGGIPRQTGDEWADDISANHKFIGSLTIDDMVELWTATNKVEFVNTKDIVTIYNTLFDYVQRIGERKWYSPNYRPPPEEDMVKMNALLSAMQDKAEGISLFEAGDDDWSQLMSMFSSTATRVDSRQRSAVAAVVEKHDNPFSFLARSNNAKR